MKSLLTFNEVHMQFNRYKFMDVKDSLLSGVSLYNSLTSKGLFLCFIYLYLFAKIQKVTTKILEDGQKLESVNGAVLQNDKNALVEFPKADKEAEKKIL